MTFRKYLVSELTEHGLWPDEAKAVMELVEADTDNMKGRWDDDTAGYPVSMKTVLWLTTKIKAVECLKATKPKHFALMILEGAAP